MRDSLQASDSILVIGASGQLGIALCQEFGSTYNVVAASRSRVDRGQHHVDLADEPGLIRLLDDVQANTILIAAAMCHVDRCELEPKVCHSVNVTGTEIIAKHASRNGALVVFFSTDHVFNGTQECYSEGDEMAPLNVYADSKSKAELALRRYVPDRHLILRTSPKMFGISSSEHLGCMVQTDNVGTLYFVWSIRWESSKHGRSLLINGAAPPTLTTLRKQHACLLSMGTLEPFMQRVLSL